MPFWSKLFSPLFSLSLSFIFSLDRSQSGLQVWKGLWIELEVAHRFLPVVVEQQVAHVLGGLLGHDLLDVLGQPRVGKVGESWDLKYVGRLWRIRATDRKKRVIMT